MNYEYENGLLHLDVHASDYTHCRLCYANVSCSQFLANLAFVIKLIVGASFLSSFELVVVCSGYAVLPVFSLIRRFHFELLRYQDNIVSFPVLK